MQTGIIVLAAGEGTRMRSATPKVLHELCGRSLLGHVLAVADALAAAVTAVVLAPDTIDRIAAHFGSGPRPAQPYQYVMQTERLGTGHAVRQAQAALADTCDEVLVLYGDTPLVRAATVRGLIEARRSADAVLALLSFRPAHPTGYGRVARDGRGRVIELIEERSATPEQRAIRECNSGIMAFKAEWLWPALARLTPNAHKGEYYLTDLVAMAVAEFGAGAALAIEAADEREAWGANDRVQLAQLDAVLRGWLLEDLMRSGVTVVDPQNTYLDVGVTIGQDTRIEPGCVLRGSTRIGARCVIGPHTTLIDTEIGDDAVVRHVLIEADTVAPGDRVGTQHAASAPASTAASGSEASASVRAHERRRK